MPIVYYPNRFNKKVAPLGDRQAFQRNLQSVKGYKQINSSGLDVVISANNDWQLDVIKLTFSAATARDYNAYIIGGMKVVEKMNDYLWFQLQSPGTAEQKITLSPGFYTGTQLASQLQTKLNANTAFTALGVTFTVVYSDTTGLFTITPSSNNIRYVDSNTSQAGREKQSIAGALFGLTTTGSFASTSVSDTTVFGLNSSAAIITASASIVTSHYHDDTHLLNIDQALKITTGTANIGVNYEVVFEELYN